MKTYNHFPAVLLFVITIVLQCSSPVSLGGASGTDVGVCVVQGTVVDTLGHPIPGCFIRLRPADYIAGDSDAGIIKRDVHADASSRFTLDSIPAGHYIIECLSPDSSAQAVSCIIDSLDSVTVLAPVTVYPMSTITGNAKNPDMPPQDGSIVQVFGLERSAVIDANGDFHLQVPAGWCRLNLHGVDPDRPDIDTVMYLKPGPNEMQRPPEPKDPPCDDLDCELSVVRELLSANHLDTVPAESVVVIENNHVTGLRLRHRGITTIPESVFRLMFVTVLDVGANDLRELPRGIDRFRMLEVLIADSNQLWTIDASIGACDSLRVIDLSYNQLQSLPEPVTYLKPQSLDLAGNMLCNLGELTRKWIDTHDPDWKGEQVCN